MGAALSLVSQSLPPKSKFSVEDIPDLTGKVVIVTGANSGECTIIGVGRLGFRPTDWSFVSW